MASTFPLPLLDAGSAQFSLAIAPPMGKPPSPWFKRVALALSIICLASAVHAQSILPDATVGEAYNFQLVTNPPQASGTTYAAQGLPDGLSVGATTGVISGTTATVGLFKGTLQLTLNGTVSPYPFQITVDPQAGAPDDHERGFGSQGRARHGFRLCPHGDKRPHELQ